MVEDATWYGARTGARPTTTTTTTTTRGEERRDDGSRRRARGCGAAAERWQSGL
jgi:hypothetical protein